MKEYITYRPSMWVTLKSKNHLGGSRTNLLGMVILKMTAGRMYWKRGDAQELVSSGADNA